MGVLDVAKLERVLQAHWAEFLDATQVMRAVLEHVRDTEFRVIAQAEPPPRHTKITVTRLTGLDAPSLEAWVEFTVPKGDGVVVGTVVVSVSWAGALSVRESYGTEFRAERP